MICFMQHLYGKSVDSRSSISELAKQSDDRLLAMGQAYMAQENKQDSAYICLSMITERRSHPEDESSQAILAEAYMLLWELNLYYYSDYAEMFTALYQAEEIYRRLRKDLSRVYLNFGILYQTIAEQYEIDAFGEKAIEKYRLAMKSAINSSNHIVADMAFGNIMSMLFESGRFDETAELNRLYNSHPAKEPSIAARFNSIYYKLLAAAHAGDYDLALTYGDKLNLLVDTEPKYSRYAYMIWNRLADIYMRKGDYRNANRCMEHCRLLLESESSGDLLVDWLKGMAALKKKEGLPSESTIFMNRYLTTKDSLLNARKMAEIDEMRVTSSIKEINREMEIIRYKNRVKTTMLWCGAVIILIAIAFVIILWRKNIQLKQRDNAIWRNTFDSRISDICSKTPQPSPEGVCGREQEENLEEECGRSADEKTDEKTGQHDERTRDIISKVVDVLRSCPEVYSTDFSSEILARLTGINYKYISRAINDTYGTNFSFLLGEYRVRESCRRINHVEGYLKLTVEAMATDVGFKSRTTFTTSFKRVIGMTPSEYIRTAKENIGK